MRRKISFQLLHIPTVHEHPLAHECVHVEVPLAVLHNVCLGAPVPLAMARTRTRRGEGEKGTHESVGWRACRSPDKKGWCQTHSHSFSSGQLFRWWSSIHALRSFLIPQPANFHLHSSAHDAPNPTPISTPSPTHFRHWEYSHLFTHCSPTSSLPQLPTSAIRPWLKCHPFIDNSIRRNSPHAPDAASTEDGYWCCGNTW